MKIRDTPIAGVHVLEIEPIEDERGFFARTWCSEEFRARGLSDVIAQTSYAYNKRSGTLRGMHFQTAPHEETKIVSCVRGRVWDVALDLRKGSPTYLQWFADELSADNFRAMYIPTGCAHGVLTLEDDCVVAYKITPTYVPSHSAGYRWDDPAFAIQWPIVHPILSVRDQNHAAYVR
jgi:dTDP-4-dehydrorhamnose 3,5-epimerase